MSSKGFFARQTRGLFHFIALAVLATTFVASASGQLYVASWHTGANDGTIGEYTSSGATITPALITGLTQPDGLVSDGIGDLFVANHYTIGEYRISGATVNSALVPVNWGNGGAGRKGRFVRSQLWAFDQ
jgi:hypothetical protein